MKRNEVMLSYGVSYRNFYGGRQEEEADYHLNDGTVYSILRNDVASRL